MEEKPTTPGEKEFVEAVKNVLQNEDEEWIERQELGKKIDREKSNNVSEGSAKSHLSTYRKYLETEEPLETKEDSITSGNPTVSWRLTQ